MPARFFAVLLFLVAGCDGGGNGNPPADGDSDVDGDTDSDTDADVDGDADTDADQDADADDETSDGDSIDPDGDLPPDECIGEPVAGERRVECGGLRFDLSVPDACVEPGCGLVVDVHGLTMTGKMEDNNTNMRELGRLNGYIVIQPNAPGTAPTTRWSDTDDSRVYDFMMRVATAYRVDERRLHFTGFSQGGFMSWRFICNHADVLASVAPAAAGLRCSLATHGSCAFEGDRMPAREIPVLFLFGSRDTNYIEPACTERIRDAMLDAWDLSVDSIVEQDDDHTWTRYTNASGTVVEVLEHAYVSSAESSVPLVPDLLGHCFPGSDDPGDEPGQLFPFNCEPPNAFRWGEAVMAFFVAHPRSE